eukprot:c3105_g1_i2 orf=406-705(+)
MFMSVSQNCQAKEKESRMCQSAQELLLHSLSSFRRLRIIEVSSFPCMKRGVKEKLDGSQGRGGQLVRFAEISVKQKLDGSQRVRRPVSEVCRDQCEAEA